MTLTSILVFIAAGLLIRFLRKGREWLLLALSALAVFWLQPSLPIRGLDFWLPLATLALASLSWLATAPPEARRLPENRTAAGVLAGVTVLAGLTRFLPAPLLTASRPPPLAGVLAALGLVGLLAGADLAGGAGSAGKGAAGDDGGRVDRHLSGAQDPGAGGGDQRGAARAGGAVDRAGGGGRPALAGLLVPGLSPDPHRA